MRNPGEPLLQLDQIGCCAGAKVGDCSGATGDPGSKAVGKIVSRELSVNEASVEAVTGASGIDNSERDAGNVIALPVLYRSGASTATFNYHGVHEVSERIQGILYRVGAGEPERFVGVGSENVDLREGVSEHGGVESARNILAVHEYLYPEPVGEAQCGMGGVAILERGQQQCPWVVLFEQSCQRRWLNAVLIGGHSSVLGIREHHGEAAQGDGMMTESDLVEALSAGNGQDMLAKQIVAKVGRPYHVVSKAA